MNRMKLYDLWNGLAAGFYGLGKAIMFILWAAVALMILANAGLYVLDNMLTVALVLGAVGSLWYGIRSYEQKLK